MLYDDYHDYCALVEQLRSDAMDALFCAMTSSNIGDERTADQHRTIRMALEEAIEGISIVLASDEARRDVEPDEWIFCGKPRRKAHFNDNFYALLDEEIKAVR